MNTIFINPNGKSLTGSSKWHRYGKEENMGANTGESMGEVRSHNLIIS